MAKDQPYVRGWAAMTRLMREGYSWSGRERKCCFLNLRDGNFADISALSGIDFPEDGRAVAATDWDGDGDLDLWMRFRSGPQLRFLRNDAPRTNHFLSMQLVGTTCNRDAIGAVVTVHAGGRKFMRQLSAGDGYLSQSTKTMHFGLADIDKIDHVTIRWPGGAAADYQHFGVDRHYRVTQGETEPKELPPRSIAIPSAPAQKSELPALARLVLRSQLPLPPATRAVIAPAGSNPAPTLICVWASWCGPCMTELQHLMNASERLTKSGLRLAAINVDNDVDRPKAFETFEKLTRQGGKPSPIAAIPLVQEVMEVFDAAIKHIRDREGLASLPTSILTDAAGNVQIVYLGPVDPDVLIADAEPFGRNRAAPNLRGSFPGRWYFQTPRNLVDLGRDLQRRGQAVAARFYADLAKRRPELPAPRTQKP